MPLELSEIPYVPSSSDKVWTMLKLAGIKPGQSTIDLGSGDGRIVIEFAKSGAEAHGVEVSEELVKKSEQNIKQSGVENRAKIELKTLWNVNLADFNVITIYGMTNIMGGLARKLKEEARPGTKLISNRFQLPNWQQTEEQNGVYLYTKK